MIVNGYAGHTCYQLNPLSSPTQLLDAQQESGKQLQEISCLICGVQTRAGHRLIGELKVVEWRKIGASFVQLLLLLRTKLPPQSIDDVICHALVDV